MKRLLLLILLGVISTSCTSEYEERLEEAKALRIKLELVQGTEFYLSNDQLENELVEIKNEIYLLAKVSGNEQLFLKEVFKN